MKTLLAFFLFVAAQASIAQVAFQPYRRAQPVVEGGTSCADWQTNTTALSDVAVFTKCSQALTNDSGATATICEFGATLYSNSSGDCHVEVWTGPNATGTQLGGSSSTVTVADNGNPGWRVFTWISSNPTISANTQFFPVVIQDSGQVIARIVFGGSFASTVYFDSTSPFVPYSLGFYVRKQ